MPKARDKRKASETNKYKFSIDKTIPHERVPYVQGQDRGVPADAFRYDDENSALENGESMLKDNLKLYNNLLKI